ncbi:uncharacterized mitochondrial protein AtMg00810-like [Dioscorea cayenensis subsp. rotundata]|uniref:Uncharacterized mitochondrial protein AtMg00810-like n=1 Tax=Dioscorea cayennensis subsp. rotundata TaxID=55577 RepID=A0AB40CVW3_DIOCR|nr:uncharacterized mitochondrial protein AtMg00810-like [Dioscorea cayenensis subsp. rotundata]
MGSSLKIVEQFKQEMENMFEMNDLGLMKYFLGFEIKQDVYGIHLSQKKYAEELLKIYKMRGCKALSIPISASTKQQLFEQSEEANATYYRCLIGKLLYLTHSRPDLMPVVSLLSRFMACPTKIQFAAARNVLRYVAGTLDFGIQYYRSSKFVLEGFSDSDWCGDLRDRKSTSGFVFNLGSGAVCWASKKQDVVALSSTETEYIALCGACCHGVWMKKILTDFGIQVEDAFPILCDNKFCILIAKNPALHGRSKHIDVKFHYIRELVNNKLMELKLSVVILLMYQCDY